MPPNTKLPVHYHPIPLCIYMIKGELNITTGKKDVTLKAGDSCIETVNIWHTGISTNGCELIAFY